MGARPRQAYQDPLCGAAASTTTQALSMTNPKRTGARKDSASAAMEPRGGSLGWVQTCQPSARYCRRVSRSATYRSAGWPESGSPLRPTK